MEFPSNAPVSLPSPSLFPGEVLRMQQHRVICTGLYSEPLVGVVYLTNFRIIFNGTPVTVSLYYCCVVVVVIIVVIVVVVVYLGS